LQLTALIVIGLVYFGPIVHTLITELGAYCWCAKPKQKSVRETGLCALRADNHILRLADVHLTGADCSQKPGEMHFTSRLPGGNKAVR